MCTLTLGASTVGVFAAVCTCSCTVASSALPKSETLVRSRSTVATETVFTTSKVVGGGEGGDVGGGGLNPPIGSGGKGGAGGGDGGAGG